MIKAQDSNAAFAGTSGQLSATQSSIFNGNVAGLLGEIAELVALSQVLKGAAQTSDYLGDRLSYGAISNTWVGHYIGAPNATTSPMNDNAGEWFGRLVA